jgi:hypothetical protein
MTTPACEFVDNRDAVLVEYLYDEMEPAGRAAFAAHLSRCPTCRSELAEMRGVRAALGRWSPPEPGRVVAGPSSAWTEMSGGRRRWWRDVPVWARAAAAVLVVGAAAGAANLRVQHDRDGVTISTGWLGRTPVAAQPAPEAPLAAAPWRADLTALEGRLLDQLGERARRQDASAAALVERVRTIVDEGEQRQRRELALRLGELANEMSVQRQADLVRIGNNLGVIMNSTGLEAIRQRQVQSELLGYLQRVSQQR